MPASATCDSSCGCQIGACDSFNTIITDVDGDGVDTNCDDDNCPAVSNPDQADTDFDDIGDACDPDDDGDGVNDGSDNCPLAFNQGQEDTDGDGLGDACDFCTDSDEDESCVEDEESDCDDDDDSVYPNAPELCDGKDNDCDDSTEEIQSTFYQDLDVDTFGNVNVVQNACAQPQGFVSNDDDCNDSNVSIKPGAAEICDLADNDCDGQTDEGDVCSEDTFETSIEIFDGWTAFSLPFNPIGIGNSEELGTAISNAAGLDCDVIMKFNGSTQLMEDDIIGLADPSFALTSTQAYFIHCEGTGIFTFDGVVWT